MIKSRSPHWIRPSYDNYREKRQQKAVSHITKLRHIWINLISLKSESIGEDVERIPVQEILISLKKTRVWNDVGNYQD